MQRYLKELRQGAQSTRHRRYDDADGGYEYGDHCSEQGFIEDSESGDPFEFNGEGSPTISDAYGGSDDDDVGVARPQPLPQTPSSGSSPRQPPTTGQAGQKRKVPGTRPDVVERASRRKGIKETVVKVSLPGTLVDPGNNSAFRNQLDAMVEFVSKCTVKASLVFNMYLIKSFENDSVLPENIFSNTTFFYQCLNVGCGKLRKDRAGLGAIWNDHFAAYPNFEALPDGHGVFLSWAAKSMRTNFLNSLVEPFYTRQNYFLKAWLTVHDLGATKQNLHWLRCAINGKPCRTPVPDGAKDIVAEHRSFLGLGDGEEISIGWLKANPRKVLKYYYEILRYLEQFDDTRRFSLAPISTPKRHHITVDVRGLCTLMKNSGLIARNVKEAQFREFVGEHFRSVFKCDALAKLTSSKHTLRECYFETDGVSVSVHYTCAKSISDAADAPGNPRDFNGERVIAIDPGRVNIAYAEEKLPDGSFKTYKLTRRRYYAEGGIKHFNQLSDKWLKPLETENAECSMHSPKTASVAKFDACIATHVSSYAKRWDILFKKKWAQQRFTVYGKKRKVLDGFFQSMHKSGERKPVVVYGAGNFPCCGRGSPSVPTKYTKKTCGRYFETFEVDEFRTSSVCPVCDQVLCKVSIFARDVFQFVSIQQFK